MPRRISFATAAFVFALALCASCEQPPSLKDASDGEPSDAAFVDGHDDGDGSDDTGAGGDDTDPSPDTRAPDTDPDASPADAGDTFSCDAVTCGGTCCAAGEVCVDGTCAAPCGGTRCGDDRLQCCTDQQVCIFGGCQTPGAACQNSFQCPEDMYCESTLGKCLPRSAQTTSCTFRPNVGAFSPSREGHFDGVDTNGRTYDKSITAPTVADIDADGLPEIVVLLYRGGLSGGLIAAINGEDMSLLAHGAVEGVRANSAGIAVGQLDPATSELEVVAPRANGGLVALKLDAQNGKLTEWWTAGSGALGDIDQESAPAIADLDGDGTPEIVFGFSVLTAKGKIWKGLNKGAAGGQRGGNAVTSVVDLDGRMSDLEIIAGNRVMKTDGTMLWDRSGDIGDGYSAVGDFGNDDAPEVVTVTDGKVYVLEGATGKTVFGPKNIPGGGEGGPPTIADFDGDGFVEFAAAGQGKYTVYDLDCTGSSPAKKRCDSGRTDGILWDKRVQDLSSSRTGSSVFDFEGDGQAEVVYNDECFLRVFDGKTGTVKFERANTSRTGSEYPIVVDVDKDFNAEIVVVSNNDQIRRDKCEQNFQNYPKGGTTGVFVYADARDNWVPTRPIWNQHPYHITNVLEDGSIPARQPLHYRSSLTNSFRLNVQPDGLFNAPDLVVSDIGVSGAACGQTPSLDVTVTVKNQGALGIGPGARVDVTATINGSTVDIGTATTTTRLLPGSSEQVSLTWSLPMGALAGSFDLAATVDPDSRINECKNDNNDASTTVDPASLMIGGLEPASLTVDDLMCGNQGKEVSFTLTVENKGRGTVVAGVPVVLESAGGVQLTTVKTTKSLAPGQTETLTGTWTTPRRLFPGRYAVIAKVDPAKTVHACGGQSMTPTEVNCSFGG